MTKGKDYLSIIKAIGTDVQPTMPATLPGIVQKAIPLLDVAVQNMGVLGTPGAPKLYIQAPANDKLFLAYSVPLILLDDAILLPGNFGGIAALVNGLELVVKQNGVDNVVCNIKTNKDLTTCFFGGQLGTGLNAAAGFMDTAKYATGSFVFDTPVLLDGSKGDQIFFRVQDDLSTIDHLEAVLKFSEMPL